MELLLFRPSDFDTEYNCSGIDIGTGGAQLDRARQNIVKLVVLLAMSTVYSVLYIPCVCSIWKHRRDNASYAILLYISVADIFELVLIGFIHAWLSLQGAVFCSYPRFIYVHGILCFECLWYAESSADVLLALERCIEMFSTDLGKMLFKGRKILFWLAIPTGFAIYNFFFAIPPALFNGIYFFYFFNPYVGYAPEIERIYEKPSQIYYDFVITCAIPFIYILFLFLLVLKSTHQDNFNFRTLFKNSLLNQAFVQVFIICMLNFLTLTIWFYIQFNGVTIWLSTIAHFAWLHIHGFPPVIYLTMNKTIRKDSGRLVKHIVGNFIKMNQFNVSRTQPAVWAAERGRKNGNNTTNNNHNNQIQCVPTIS